MNVHPLFIGRSLGSLLTDQSPYKGERSVNGQSVNGSTVQPFPASGALASAPCPSRLS